MLNWYGQAAGHHAAVGHHGSAVCARGDNPVMGPITCRVLVGGRDEVRRFDDKKAVANYGGLTPTIYQSGGVTHLGWINRDGRLEVRCVLLQCAHAVARMKPSQGAKPLQQFYARLASRRGKKVATVAVTRKLLTTA